MALDKVSSASASPQCVQNVQKGVLEMSLPMIFDAVFSALTFGIRYFDPTNSKDRLFG